MVGVVGWSPQPLRRRFSGLHTHTTAHAAAHHAAAGRGCGCWRRSTPARGRSRAGCGRRRRARHRTRRRSCCRTIGKRIKPTSWGSRRRGMAIIAIQPGGITMPSRQVMASTTTRGQYFVMINNPCWYPSLRCLVMAGLTGVGTGDVATTLTRGEGAVMATDAIRRNRCVIHRSAQPRCGHVTHITLIIRRDMRAGFTRCRGTVMTRAASTDNLPMIYRYGRRPSYGTWRVAGITDCGRA